MARPRKTPEPDTLTSMDLARRLREGLVNDPDFAPDDIPSSRGVGIYEPNCEFHLNTQDGRRYTVLVVRAS